ncbi:MAG: hypothetical protein HOH66_06400 [Rhodospirillaceae bacterium]|jgi:hypothetical protein|nr:hypothetical protein [Rhodospirillaceae bacterium]MBT6117481.1 hypothetical protein [Rhodospirillaceae bacterium]
MADEKAPTNAELAAKVLRNVAAHDRTMANENPEVQDRMLHNAEVCEEVARMVEEDPGGTFDESAVAEADSTVH